MNSYCSGNIDAPGVKAEFDRQGLRVAEHNSAVDVSPAELGGDWGRRGSEGLEPKQFFHEGIEGAFRYAPMSMPSGMA